MKKPQDSHWRKVMNTKFLNGDELQEDGQVVTITSYKEEELYSQKAKDVEKHVTLLFKEFEKPMILTNRKAKQISNVLETSLMDEWVGKTVTIYPKQEKHFGDWFAVINIKPGAIKKEDFTPKHERWDGACKSIKEGKSTIEAIEKHYTLTPTNKAKLVALVPKAKK
jgi:hypothetical protein